METLNSKIPENDYKILQNHLNEKDETVKLHLNIFHLKNNIDLLREEILQEILKPSVVKKYFNDVVILSDSLIKVGGYEEAAFLLKESLYFFENNKKVQRDFEIMEFYIKIINLLRNLYHNDKFQENLLKNVIVNISDFLDKNKQALKNEEVKLMEEELAFFIYKISLYFSYIKSLDKFQISLDTYKNLKNFIINKNIFDEVKWREIKLEMELLLLKSDYNIHHYEKLKEEISSLYLKDYRTCLIYIQLNILIFQIDSNINGKHNLKLMEENKKIFEECRKIFDADFELDILELQDLMNIIMFYSKNTSDFDFFKEDFENFSLKLEELEKYNYLEDIERKNFNDFKEYIIKKYY